MTTLINFLEPATNADAIEYVKDETMAEASAWLAKLLEERERAREMARNEGEV